MSNARPTCKHPRCPVCNHLMDEDGHKPYECKFIQKDKLIIELRKKIAELEKKQ